MPLSGEGIQNWRKKTSQSYSVMLLTSASPSSDKYGAMVDKTFCADVVCVEHESRFAVQADGANVWITSFSGSVSGF